MNVQRAACVGMCWYAYIYLFILAHKNKGKKCHKETIFTRHIWRKCMTWMQMCRFNRISRKCDINAISEPCWVNLSDNVYLTTEDNDIRQQWQRAHAGNSRDSCALFFVYSKMPTPSYLKDIWVISCFLLAHVHSLLCAWHCYNIYRGRKCHIWSVRSAMLWYSTSMPMPCTAFTLCLLAYQSTKMQL